MSGPGSLRYRIAMYSCGVLLLAVVFVPVAWLAISSVSNQNDLLAVPTHLWPKHATFARYRDIFTGDATQSVGAALRKAMLNSLFVATCSVVLSLACAIFGAYAFARLKFRLRTGVFVLFLITYMMPPLALIIPMYLTMSALGLLDTRVGLIFVYCSFTTPFVLWLLSSYFGQLPVELEEAAMIDGCTRVGALFRIVLPLARPGIIAAGLLAFLAAWDEFFYALIFTSSPRSKTIPVALTEFTGRYSLDFGLMAAGGILASIPPVLIALALQRHITSGLVSGGVK